MEILLRHPRNLKPENGRKTVRVTVGIVMEAKDEGNVWDEGRVNKEWK
jgi:hypothetical protein